MVILMIRRTKIIATLGPATDEPGILVQMIQAGVDLVRVNFSHGDIEEHRDRIEAVSMKIVKVEKSI